MPGGIGPIDARTSAACRSGRLLRTIRAGADEGEIFYNLDSGWAHYDTGRGLLYFMASPHAPVQAVLEAVCATGRPPPIERVILDRHGMFHTGRRVALAAEWADAVLVALRLAGMRVTVASSAAPAAPPPRDTPPG